MSRDHQPIRVRILSSGGAPVIAGRRRTDRVVGFDTSETDTAPVRPVHLPVRTQTGAALSLRQMAGLFLCSSALGGACAVAFGLFGMPVR